MSSEEKVLKVSKIEHGTVIDHIPAGRALYVLRLLGLTGKEGVIISLAMNIPSRKLGKKDVVKVEGLELSEDQVNKLALIAPSATINIIKDYEVSTKMKISIPEVISGILKCKNPNCITRKEREPVISSFRVVKRKPLLLRCEYCGRFLTEEDVVEQLTGG